MKDGRTHLAHKAEHAVDFDSGAIVAVTVQGADTGDTTTLIETVTAAAEQVEASQPTADEPPEVRAIVADKGYHSNEVLVDLQAVGVRSYVVRAGPGATAIGPRRRRPKRRSMRIAGVFGGTVASACCAAGAN